MLRRVYISVSNDLATDQRLIRTAGSLHSAGAGIVILGRQLKGSLPFPPGPYRIRRFRLFVNTGFLFYALLNIRLFFFLLVSRKGILLSVDLDTLPANFLVSRLRGMPLVFDANEYFTGSPELQGRRMVRAFWKFIEKCTVPHIRHRYTVNSSIAGLYYDDYGVTFGVVRNVSRKWAGTRPTRQELALPPGRFVMILQGTGINMDRGGMEAVQAMNYLEGVLLLVVGSGSAVAQMKDLSRQLALGDRVMFIDRLPWERLMEYTASADLGLSLDKPTNLNYLYSLPNKLFDYLQAGIPVLATDLPEIRSVVTGYDTGWLIQSLDPVQLAGLINEIRRSPQLAGKKASARRAAAELCWEKEEKTLIRIFSDAGLIVRSELPENPQQQKI